MTSEGGKDNLGIGIDPSIKFREKCMMNKIEYAPAAAQEAVIRGQKYRFTVLTSRLIRLEYQEEGLFEDGATKLAINRQFTVPAFQVTEGEGSLEITTAHLRLYYDKQSFSANGLFIQLLGNYSAYRSTWFYGETGDNLKGTARTLDGADGAIPLEDGLLSRKGFSVADDTGSPLLLENGWVVPRKTKGLDLYFFGYGRAYRDCLKDFFHLSGATPLLPRFTLGNWWSRYFRYTDKSYRALMDRFHEEGVPFSVAVLDMDWHLTQVESQYGSGWTGYTWDPECFPDPEGFLRWLHEKGLHVTLNVHPADGIRAFEDKYESMALAMGMDPAKGQKIDFDASDPKFWEAYFQCIHHPLEKQGVDFWWIDWQQQGGSKKSGYDPLFMLNHLHFLDSMKNGRQGLTFSRYAGLGSHRYPIGFSGDTYSTWDSLAFQPYFTATASNAGYGWWSHDIGGHMLGSKSDERFVRWLQLGVFSPILRIHSSNSPFFVKEPWGYDAHISSILKKYLSLRHRLIPYLYTMNYRCHEEGELLVEPLYYRYPEKEEAYWIKNAFFFGTALLVCPITVPRDARTCLAPFKGWLPEGIWYDIFKGSRYRGGRALTFYRDLEEIPVFAEAGTILPLSRQEEVKNSTENPRGLDVYVFAGKSGTFTLVEDDLAEGEEKRGYKVQTRFSYQSGPMAECVIQTEDDQGILPADRFFVLHVFGIECPPAVQATGGSREEVVPVQYDGDRHVLKADLRQMTGERDIRITFTERTATEERKKEAFQVLERAQVEYILKEAAWHVLQKEQPVESTIGELLTLQMDEGILGALTEILSR